jgi:iron complex transport system ATP-binding protein
MIGHLDDVSFSYRAHRKDALHRVTLEIAGGEHTAIVGPNGAGKSTLLRLLVGLLEPDSGAVSLFGRPVVGWTRRDLARRVAVVSQGPEADVPMTLRTVVEMGRNPYVRPWSPLAREDHRRVDEALAAADLTALQARDIRELSGGEVQRARLARALAQDPELLLLDEPTAHLDLGHEMSFFELVADLVARKSVTVVSVTHHLNVAARFSSRMVLLAGGEVRAVGSPEQVMTASSLKSAFDWPVKVEDLGRLGRHAIPVRTSGEEPA